MTVKEPYHGWTIRDEFGGTIFKYHEDEQKFLTLPMWERIEKEYVDGNIKRRNDKEIPGQPDNDSEFEGGAK
jgi:hypothetical protein